MAFFDEEGAAVQAVTPSTAAKGDISSILIDLHTITLDEWLKLHNFSDWKGPLTEYLDIESIADVRYVTDDDVNDFLAVLKQDHHSILKSKKIKDRIKFKKMFGQLAIDYAKIMTHSNNNNHNNNNNNHNKNNNTNNNNSNMTHAQYTNRNSSMNECQSACQSLLNNKIFSLLETNKRVFAEYKDSFSIWFSELEMILHKINSTNSANIGRLTQKCITFNEQLKVDIDNHKKNNVKFDSKTIELKKKELESLESEWEKLSIQSQNKNKFEFFNINDLLINLEATVKTYQDNELKLEEKEQKGNDEATEHQGQAGQQDSKIEQKQKDDRERKDNDKTRKKKNGRGKPNEKRKNDGCDHSGTSSSGNEGGNEGGIEGGIDTNNNNNDLNSSQMNNNSNMFENEGQPQSSTRNCMSNGIANGNINNVEEKQSEMMNGNNDNHNVRNDINNNNMKVQQMIEDVINISNSVFYRREHEHIQRLQGSPAYVAALAQVEAIEIKYIERLEQCQREKSSHKMENGDGNPQKLAQLQLEHDEMIKRLKAEKEEERNKFLESQNHEICSLLRASFFAAECRQQLFNEFDSQFLNPLKNEWIQRKCEQLNCFSKEDKESQFVNEHPLLFLRKQELIRDTELVAYLIYFGTHTHILDLRKQAMDGIIEGYKKQIALEMSPNENNNDNNGNDKNGDNSNNNNGNNQSEDEEVAYFRCKTKELFYQNLFRWITHRLSEITGLYDQHLNESKDQNHRVEIQSRKQHIDDVRNQQNNDFVRQQTQLAQEHQYMVYQQHHDCILAQQEQQEELLQAALMTQNPLRLQQAHAAQAVQVQQGQFANGVTPGGGADQDAQPF